MVTFNSSASVKKSWIDVSTRAGYNKLLSAINDIEAAGGTNLDAALRLANTQMQSKSITQIDQSKRNVIALTDGVPTYYVGTGWVVNDKNVSQHGNYGCPDTNIATATSATALKANVNAVYTVCFGAAGDQCWTKGSAHAWTGGLFPEEKEWHQTDGPTVGDFLKNSIATQPANGSNKQYAYNAVNADKLYEVFAAITQTITEGLNEGVVTDGLPTGVTAVQGSGFEHTWTLDSSSVTPTTSNGYNVYTYTKTYKVNVDPATVNTVEVGGANYAPLNTPTILTVQHNGSPVQIPFPIPAIRINITQATVTFKVENGTWSDGETGDKTTTVTMINGKGTLPTSAVPTEMKANANYEGGAWDTTPNTKANGITGDATYTYSFTPTSGTATVTFKVENGTWSDGTNADKTVTVNLSAGKGTLSNSDVPTGMEANANYEGGAWDTTPNTKANGITGDATYTYSFTPTSGTATVTFKVENGTWSDGTNADKTVTVNLSAGKGTLPTSAVPTGMEANANYENGTWNTTPNTEANGITGDATYTYSFTPTSGTATVTFKVENGTWSDGTNADKTVTVNLSAGKGTLPTSAVPTGMEANANYENGTWNTTPNTEANGITGDVTYTYRFVPKKVWDTKQLKTATKLNTSDWTTTVTLKLPTVSKTEANSTETEVPPDPITAISEGSKVEDTIGKKFTLVGIGDSALENGSFTMTVGGKEITGVVINGHTVNFGEPNSDGSYRYTVDYALTNNTFTWNINEDVYAGTEVTLSYKLKLTTPNKTTGTYGVEDLNGDGKVDGTDVAVDPNKALYTNESATLYKDANTKLAEFPKPSVSYTVSSGSSGSHSGGSRPSLNTKDHYGYIIGYPVDYYTGQPTTDQTKKPVRPEGKITRAEVATIYFRMLTDESRTKFWSQSNAYSDVKAGDWFNNAVSTLSNAGIIAGYEDGSFRPNGYITRAEFATIAARFFDVTYNGKDLFPDISGHWAKDYINQAANKGFVNGYEDGTFKPDRNITRAEAVTLVNRTLDRHPDKNHFTKDMLVWPDNMDQTKWYYADMQEATNSHTYQMKENSDKTKYENWTKTLPIRNWEALEKAWSNANSSQGNGNVV